ncbi:hypothetical protein BU17DRAFT_101961 [Hysterangium stoloniferum]|nr:hypothetical protein BU17DRAFT_101961 [Hysterangium stoloniferum]
MPMPYRTPPAPPHLSNLSRPPVTVLASPISRPSLSLSLSLPLPAFSPVTVPPYRPSPLQDRHHVVIEDAAADAPAPYRTPQPARQPHPISLSSPPLPAFSPVTVPPYRPSPLQERHHVVIEDAAVDAPMPYRTPCLSLSLPPSSGILACLGTRIVHPSPSRRTTKTKSPSLHRTINPAKPRCRTARTAYIPAPRLAAHKRAGGAAMRCLSPSWCVFSASTKSG